MCRYNPHNFTCCPEKVFGAAEGEEKHLHCTPCQLATFSKKPCTKTKNRIDRSTIIAIPDQKCYSCRKEWQEEQNAAMALMTMSYNDVFAGQDFDLGKVEEEERVRREEAAEALLELRLNGRQRVFTQDLDSGNQSQQSMQNQQARQTQQPRQNQRAQQRQQPKQTQKPKQIQEPKQTKQPEQSQEPNKPSPIFRAEPSGKIYKIKKIVDSRLHYGKLQYKSQEFDYPVDSTYYPARLFEGCEELMEAFHRANPERPTVEDERAFVKAKKVKKEKTETGSLFPGLR
jgi:hypothetical protein